MPRVPSSLILVGLLGATLLALTGCAHVADALTNTGEALRRHSDQSGSAGQGAAGGTNAGHAPQGTGGATQAQFDAITTELKAKLDECRASASNPELDPIRHKVELFRPAGDQPLPFEIATNDNFPSADERPVIAKWASLRDECIRRMDEVNLVPQGANAMQTAVLTQLRTFAHQLAADVTDLMISLYQQKLTYAEFGRKIYEVSKAQGAFNLAMQQASAASNNTQQQLQDLQTSQQQYTDTLDAFSKYVKVVSARKPKTVHMKGAGG